MKVTFVTGSGNLVLSIYTKIEMLMIIDKKSWDQLGLAFMVGGN